MPQVMSAMENKGALYSRRQDGMTPKKNCKNQESKFLETLLITGKPLTMGANNFITNNHAMVEIEQTVQQHEKQAFFT
jgi:hypothetical protein